MGKVVKKIKKAVKKAVKQVTKPIAALAGGVETPEMPEQVTPAQAVEIATPEKVEHEDEAQTEAGRKKAARAGKKSLSVARASGGGLNI